ncbi:MAG: DUF5615 family PIN-like protein [Thermoproteota archaeon]
MVLITADLDFGKILAYTEHKKPSVIILRLKNPAPDNVNSILSSILPRMGESLKKDSIVMVEEDKIRVRELPIEKKK